MNERFKFRAWHKASKKMYNVMELGFVDGCLQYLLDGLNVFYYAKEIKQAIREADWDWE